MEASTNSCQLTLSAAAVRPHISGSTCPQTPGVRLLQGAVVEAPIALEVVVTQPVRQAHDRLLKVRTRTRGPPEIAVVLVCFTNHGPGKRLDLIEVTRHLQSSAARTARTDRLRMPCSRSWDKEARYGPWGTLCREGHGTTHRFRHNEDRP